MLQSNCEQSSRKSIASSRNCLQAIDASCLSIQALISLIPVVRAKTQHQIKQILAYVEPNGNNYFSSHRDFFLLRSLGASCAAAGAAPMGLWGSLVCSRSSHDSSPQTNRLNSSCSNHAEQRSVREWAAGNADDGYCSFGEMTDLLCQQHRTIWIQSRYAAIPLVDTLAHNKQDIGVRRTS